MRHCAEAPTAGMDHPPKHAAVNSGGENLSPSQSSSCNLTPSIPSYPWSALQVNHTTWADMTTLPSCTPLVPKPATLAALESNYSHTMCWRKSCVVGRAVRRGLHSWNKGCLVPFYAICPWPFHPTTSATTATCFCIRRLLTAAQLTSPRLRVGSWRKRLNTAHRQFTTHTSCPFFFLLPWARES